MNRSKFESVFRRDKSILNHMLVSGYKSYYYLLRKFDRFCIEYEICQPIFTHQHAKNGYIGKKRTSTTHYARVNGIKRHIPQPQEYRFCDKRYQPESLISATIYTEDEITRYFHAVDTYESSRNRKDAIQFPILFRLLYCCGTRINETLGIRKLDVDLGDGIIRLFETKNNCERHVVLSGELGVLMQKYAEKCFYLLDDEQYIFTTSNGRRLSGDVVYEVIGFFFKRLGFPYLGGRGPRLHGGVILSVHPLNRY